MASRVATREYRNELNNLTAANNDVIRKLQKSKGYTLNHAQLANTTRALSAFLKNDTLSLHEKQAYLETAVNNIKRLKPDATNNNDDDLRTFKRSILQTVQTSLRSIEDRIFDELYYINENVCDNGDEIIRNRSEIRANGRANKESHQHTHQQVEQLQHGVDVGNNIALLSTAVAVGSAIVSVGPYAVQTMYAASQIVPAAVLFGLSFLG